MTNDSVSIIIPTYNRAHVLGRAIRSVFDQRYPHWELLVVDDGSTDATVSLVEGLDDPRVRYLPIEHSGVSAARNEGIRQARHSWVTFLDSDDCWLPKKLERELAELHRCPDYRVVYTNEVWIRRGVRANQKNRHRKFSGWVFAKCLPLCIISPSSVLLHRDVLVQCGTFDESLPVCEDYDLWLRIAARFPVLFVDEPLIVKTGGHDDQLSRSLWGMDRYRLRALVRLYQSGWLTPAQRQATALEIGEKARILETGFEKRGKPEEAAAYRRIWRDWSMLAGVSPTGSQSGGF